MLIRFLSTLCLLAITLIPSQVKSFNLDLHWPVLKQATNKNSYFGYSVAQHSTSKGPFILVGAPKDTYKSHNQSGAIYKCPLTLDAPDDCEQIDVDFESQTGDESSKKNYDKVIKVRT